MSAPLPGFEEFSGQLNRAFDARLDGAEPVQLLLTECVSEPGNPASFMLTFLAPPGAAAEQGTFLVSSPELGELPIFLVPARRHPGGVDFHAVFNQLQEG